MTVAVSPIPEVADPSLPSRKQIKRLRQLKLIEDRPRPILKWAGGKARLIDDLLKVIPETYDRHGYHEPFVGGGALFFALSARIRVRPGTGWRPVLSDSNEDLIHLYREVVADPEGLHRAAWELVERHRLQGEAHYYAVRAAWNADRASLSPAARAATMIYLNRACFNGLFRTNKSGHLNTPVGRGGGLSDWPIAPSVAQLRAASVALSSAELAVSDFRTSLSRVSPGDLVYLDPPYVPRSPSASFRAYTPGGFGLEDHADMATIAARLVDDGVTVIISSSDAPGSRDLYPASFAVIQVTAPRAISATAASRTRVNELIFVGVPR